MIVTEVPVDPTRPLGMCRLVLCEARESRFTMSLPPGRYVLDAYDGQFKGKLRKEIIVAGDTPEVDLGIVTLLPARPNINDMIKQSQAGGAMGDYTKHYGEKLPAWHIVDARGIDKNAQLSDFKGKWVLVDFWGLNCTACLKHSLPKLAKFYDDHKTERDRFEILAICVDCNGEMKSVAEVDRALEPIVKHVWGGKPLPFPVLLDPSMTTLERFGVPGYETILIDPDGTLVEGDESVLAGKLKK
jgi:thiol-disulfide isomerase/thioredoxin